MNENEMELYFGRKALDDAILTGENQIFLSASPLESQLIQDHILDLARSHDMVLTGNPLVLPNGAMLVFLLTSHRAASGFSGNAYVINCFDETNFDYINALASSWTMRKKHRAVFFSIN